MYDRKKLQMAKDYLREFGNLSNDLAMWLIDEVENAHKVKEDPEPDRGGLGDW